MTEQRKVMELEANRVARLLGAAFLVAEHEHAKDKAVVAARRKVDAAATAMQAAAQAYAAAKRDRHQASIELQSALTKYLPKTIRPQL